MLRAFFLRVSFRIDQANRLVFVDRHLHNAVIILGSIQWAVSIIFRKAANTSPFKRSGHFIHLVLSAEAASYARSLRNRSQVLQLTIDLIKPCLQRCALLFKRFFLRGRRIYTRKTTAKATAWHAPASGAALASDSIDRELSICRRACASAQSSSCHCSRTHRSGSVSSWHIISPRFIIGICRLQFQYTRLLAYVNKKIEGICHLETPGYGTPREIRIKTIFKHVRVPDLPQASWTLFHHPG